MENIRPTLHPVLMVAAASVTALSLAGIGVLTGVLPFNQKLAADPISATQPAPTPAAAVPPAPTVAVNISNTPAVREAAPVPRVAAKRPSEPRPLRVAQAEKPAYPSVERLPEPVRAQPAPAICRDCGVVESVKEIAREGEGSGLGAAIGGVVGGVVGNQVGRGTGRDLATAVGILGGVIAGNQIEKSQKRVVEHQVTVRFEDGGTRVFTMGTPPAWREGDRVKVENGLLVARV